MEQHADIAIIGAGAAGLMAAAWAGRTARSHPSAPRILLLDGARTLGAKILVAGGGRCNVTHHAVDERAFAGSTPAAIKTVLRSFPVERTTQFFRELGVELKREETGKLFPTTDSARTVLDALLRAAREAGVDIIYPWRVGSVDRTVDGFIVRREPTAADESTESSPTIHAQRLILATGGLSLPKSGSDGKGYEFARSLGHSITPSVFPALVPLIADKSRTFVNDLSGISRRVELMLFSGTGKKLNAFTDSLLCTHFGISGPAALDLSRYWTDARAHDPQATIAVNWLPGRSFDQVDASLLGGAPGGGGGGGEPSTSGRSAVGTARAISELDPADPIPDRLARAICASVGVDPALPVRSLGREQRRALAHALTRTVLPITGDRGYTHAEVTAGGVPLSEVRLQTMESRVCPGLYLCGEICDVDGRIGGFNFQWAWASGFIAGNAAAEATSL